MPRSGRSWPIAITQQFALQAPIKQIPYLPQNLNFRITVWTTEFFPVIGKHLTTGFGPDFPPGLAFSYTESIYVTHPAARRAAAPLPLCRADARPRFAGARSQEPSRGRTQGHSPGAIRRDRPRRVHADDHELLCECRLPVPLLGSRGLADVRDRKPRAAALDAAVILRPKAALAATVQSSVPTSAPRSTQPGASGAARASPRGRRGAARFCRPVGGDCPHPPYRVCRGYLVRAQSRSGNVRHVRIRRCPGGLRRRRSNQLRDRHARDPQDRTRPAGRGEGGRRGTRRAGDHRRVRRCPAGGACAAAQQQRGTRGA